jgi:hypothetical protein
LLALDVAVFAADGQSRLAATVRGPLCDPGGLGRRMAQLLRDQDSAFVTKGGP